jgi:Tat protein secretion system quality control protein TatD with DNase activity
LADTGRIRAVGETGLDYYWPVVNFLQLQGLDRSDIERTMAENRDEILHEAPVKKALRIQRLVFARCIELAKELGLPLVIHEREALTDTMELLDKCRIPPDQVMFHCFGHGKSEAAAVLKAGYWISLPSSLGFRDPFREVAEDIPLERLLLETDSPYHSPVPGLWKQARALAQQEQLAKGTRGKEKEKLLRETGRNHFVKSVEEHFPGLEFTFREGKASVPAKTYFIESSDNRRINEPAFIRSSAMSMALIRKQPLKDICRITSENASHFYRL